MKKSLGAKTVIFPTPVLVIGSYDRENHPNVMTAAWGGICCSEPPCVSVSLRKSRLSYENILENKAFTVNIPSEKFTQHADYYGIVSGRKENKLQVSRLTAIKSEIVDAPYIDEFPFILECKLLHTLEVGVHTIFIGEILDVKAEHSVIDDKNRIDIKKVDPILFAPEDHCYYGVGEFVGQGFSIGRKKFV